MASLQQTYRGDLTSALAGTIASKVLNAAGMAKEERERRETEAIEKAEPGSLFASALGHEFGGDLYNRTLGNFDSKKPIAQTDRSSSKEARFRAKYAGFQAKPVQEAQEKMKEDDGELSVKDQKLRQTTAKILGSSVERKLNVVDFSVTELSGEIKSLNSNLSHTNQLIFDQNQMLASKFDLLLEHFNSTRDFQKELIEEGKVRRREEELEYSRDLSTSKKIDQFEQVKKQNPSLFSVLGNTLLRDKFFKKAADKIKNVSDVVDSIGGSKGFGKLGGKGIRKLFSTGILSIGRRGVLFSKENLDKSTATLRAQLDVMGDPDLFKGKKVDISSEDALLKNLMEGTIDINPRSGDVTVKQPKSRGLDILNSLLGEAPDDTAKIAKETLESNIVYMSRVLGAPVGEISKTLDDPGKFKKLQGRLQHEMAMGLDPKVATEILNQAEGLKSYRANKIAEKAGPDIAEKIGKKAMDPAVASKFAKGGLAAKLFGKGGKLVPGLGAGIAFTEAGIRWAQGDKTGAVLSVLSGIPIAGWAFTAIDVGRDLGLNLPGIPPAPNQYERGTELTKPGYGILHGTEAVVGKGDSKDFSESMLRNYDDQISYFASSALSMANRTGTTKEVSSLVKKSGLSYDFVNIPFSSSIGNLQQASSVREPSRAIERLLRLRDRQIFNQYKKLQDPEDLDRLDPKNLDKASNNMETPQPQVQQIAQANLHIPTGNTSITFSKEQGIDASGEPGVDFSFGDYKSNYSLFDGVVVETGKLYGSGYGNVVTVRSKDANGREFDAMYAHFGDGTIAVKTGQKVKAGDYLGPVGWDEANGRPAPGAGNMTGPHTSLDFFEPNTKPGEVTGPFTDRGPIIEAIMQGGVPSTNGGGGGIGGPGMMGPQSPMSNADYYSLLAISALEDDDDQGRADVAQALYNRLEGHRAGSNYYQRSNTLKSHIVAKDQFQPTFYNKADWHRIVDMETAITALVMSKKGRARGWTRDYALQVLNETEKALLNPELQAEAARHVKGRTYFLGTSEQGNMQAGDVLRNPDDNFFSMWYDEDNPYGSNGVPPAAAIPPRMIAPDPGPLPPPPVTPPGNQWWDMLDLFPNQSKLNDMEMISANMDEMEDGIPVQTVVINNTVIRNQSNTHISSNTSFDNPVRKYQMAALGA